MPAVILILASLAPARVEQMHACILGGEGGMLVMGGTHLLDADACAPAAGAVVAVVAAAGVVARVGWGGPIVRYPPVAPTGGWVRLVANTQVVDPPIADPLALIANQMVDCANCGGGRRPFWEPLTQ